MDRRAALWAVKGMAPEARVEADAPLLALMGRPDEGAVSLPEMALSAHVAEDYRTTSLSLKAHPCQFFRPLLDQTGRGDRRLAARAYATARGSRSAGWC